MRPGLGLGTSALAALLADVSSPPAGARETNGAVQPPPHFAPTAKHVIYLFQSGAPSQVDLFDYKPRIASLRGSDLPDSIRSGQRLTTMSAGQERLPVAPSTFRFAQRGACGAWVSELLPHTARMVDDLCFVKSMHTDAINHDPAITFLQTGSQMAGRPSMGAWLAYGLGSHCDDLPTFVAMVSGTDGQPLYDRLWGSGFLPSAYQGVKLRSRGDPVLYLSDPPGLDRLSRRKLLDNLARLNRIQQELYQDPEIDARIAQYEMAFRMQASVPELTDLSDEPESVFAMYGPDSRQPGTFAYHCLLARRLVERGVRFVELFQRGWDHHQNLPSEIRKRCRATDQASAALVADLKQRGLLDQTLVVWGGEFGRTIYCQGTLSPDNYGRDHHPRCFTIWMAGGGVRPGQSYGQTDDFSYNIVRDPVDVHDLHATLLHLLGIDHRKLTYKYQGRRHRLTDVAGNVVRGLLA